MPIPISPSKEKALIHDLLNAQFDFTEAQACYGLSPDDLSQWIMQDANRKRLTGLCVLTDLQTQLLLSRYRLHAATVLYKLAEQDDEGDKAKQDLVRRACVDLLKLNLPTDDAPPPADQLPGSNLLAFNDLVNEVADTHTEQATDPQHDSENPADD